VFEWLRREGQVPIDDMRRTFNMGVGLIVVSAWSDAGRVLELLTQGGDQPWVIGRIEAGDRRVVYV
jgi:phosphoribosylformylglycinamidine cyclo-ligase